MAGRARDRVPGRRAAVRDAAQTPLATLDSLQTVELWIATEELGMDLPEELFFTLTTLGDFFYYYETKVARA